MIVPFVICAALALRWNSVEADCDVVKRKQWDGTNPLHTEYLPRPVNLVIIQHTASPTCGTDAECEELVRNIQDYHMDTMKYWDIGMNFLVGGNGKIYEGPGWLRVGAHTYKYNRRSVAISFIGNYNNEEPTQGQLDAVKALIKCGVEMGHLSQNYNLVAHKQLIATESPGRKLNREIRNWPHFLEDATPILNKD